MPRKSADAWFAEYGESHRDPANKAIHWVCVPAIFACVMAFVWSIPVPAVLLENAPWFNWTLVAIALAGAFYFRLSVALAAGMLFLMSVVYTLIGVLDILLPWPVWRVAAVVFALAWIGQFVGHAIEGRKPSFLKDLAFLLIGPAWLLAHLYRRIGQEY
jgi:uncharacterized membrane protein YGL010W